MNKINTHESKLVSQKALTGQKEHIIHKNQKKPEKPEFSLVVPAYNEQKNLKILLNEYRLQKKGIDFQLVVVNNGSTDNTAGFLSRITRSKAYNFIKIVTVKKNIGYGHGIHTGLKQCDANIVGFSHADMQCPPRDAFIAYRMYKKLAARHNNKLLVKGNRRGRTWQSKVLTYGLALYSTLVLFKIFDDINGQPKVFSRDLLKTFKTPTTGFAYDIYVQYKAKKGGCAVKSFKVNFNERIYGISKWASNVRSKFKTIKSFFRDVLLMRRGVLK